MPQQDENRNLIEQLSSSSTGSDALLSEYRMKLSVTEAGMEALRREHQEELKRQCEIADERVRGESEQARERMNLAITNRETEVSSILPV